MFDEKQVGDVARAAMETILLPSWKKIEKLQAYEKTPGELVTSADIESQRFIAQELRLLCPKARFLGEELQSENPLDMSRLDQYEQLWIVDPLDGTLSFSRGESTFAVMIAFVEKGVVKASWIATPQQETLKGTSCCLAWATHNKRTYLNDIPFQHNPKPFPETARGVVGMKYFTPNMREEISEKSSMLGTHRLPTSAGVDLLELAKGHVDYLLYNRTLPWDFAAPLFWAAQAGFFARRFSGEAVALKPEKAGLLCARTRQDWLHLRANIVAKTSHEEADCEKISSETGVFV